jgi:hypothetical protein
MISKCDKAIIAAEVLFWVVVVSMLGLLMYMQLTDYSITVDSCHNGDFFKLRGKVYKCVWL